MSDLEAIGKAGDTAVVDSALGWMIGKRPPEPTNDVFSRREKTYFPFPSNPSQRRVAHLVDDPRSRITVIQGPPGTGKSLTIANLVCHLVAKGKRVLVTSQKDKALQVVDDLLSSLNMAQLPMTLLHRDRESKKELAQRLESIQKERSTEEAQQAVAKQSAEHQKAVEQHNSGEDVLRRALKAEREIALADRDLSGATGFISRFIAGLKLGHRLRHAERHAKVRSNEIGDSLSDARQRIRDLAVKLLQEAGDHRVSTANRSERQQLREFARLLGRDQANYRNFRVFDRLKAEPERCSMLLKILPCWIMSPDDVARLFPCETGVFDVIIVDEASQCDLPSMTPVLYRAHQAVITGDSRQMQAQRFAFTSGQVSAQAWAQYGLNTFDPARWLDPAKVDLLQLATLRMDEEAFLNEHYRSLPDIIDFSNQRWYGGRLRIMRDRGDKRAGDPETPAISLHRVNGRVTPGTQENEAEARAVLQHLQSLLNHPAYFDATFGVICLFEQQMRLVNELVAEEIDDESRLAHELVVVNPDGFQGDERDVILYSLSFDANGMTREQLSARQAERTHIQGMLNVAFTRPRDEVHIFHSADIAEFGMADGKGAIRDWLQHCIAQRDKTRPEDVPLESQLAKADSEFEQQVMSALAERDIEVYAQYPCCGFFIDIVAVRNDRRIAIECDGEWIHLDEHGNLRIEDLERQEVLERAGWEVLRIPYRSWREAREAQIARIVTALQDDPEDPIVDNPTDTPATKTEHEAYQPQAGPKVRVDEIELAILEAIRAGARDRKQVFRLARIRLGHGSLGSRIRASLEQAVESLMKKGILRDEEEELFFRNGETRDSQYEVQPVWRPSHYSPRRRRRRYSNRRW